MTIRRYAPVKKSAGTRIPADMRLRVLHRDGGCVGFTVFRSWLRGECFGTLELDHVRASGGTGMKSRTEDDNLVVLCGGCHRWKTENGRVARPILLDYLARSAT